ncbi:hypothetical protein BC2230_20684 [Burkholderia cepacia]
MRNAVTDPKRKVLYGVALKPRTIIRPTHEAKASTEAEEDDVPRGAKSHFRPPGRVDRAEEPLICRACRTLKAPIQSGPVESTSPGLPQQRYDVARRLGIQLRSWPILPGNQTGTHRKVFVRENPAPATSVFC